MRDEGTASVEFSMAMGMLLMPVALALLSFGPWLETRMQVESIAAEAARSVVVSGSWETGRSTIGRLAQDYRIGADELRVGWCGAHPSSLTETPACPMDRGISVLVSVSVWTPLFSTPWGSVGGVWVSASHAEPVDLYRSVD